MVLISGNFFEHFSLLACTQPPISTSSGLKTTQHINASKNTLRTCNPPRFNAFGVKLLPPHTNTLPRWLCNEFTCRCARGWTPDLAADVWRCVQGMKAWPLIQRDNGMRWDGELKGWKIDGRAPSEDMANKDTSPCFPAVISHTSGSVIWVKTESISDTQSTTQPWPYSD